MRLGCSVGCNYKRMFKMAKIEIDDKWIECAKTLAAANKCSVDLVLNSAFEVYYTLCIKTQQGWKFHATDENGKVVHFLGSYAKEQKLN